MPRVPKTTFNQWFYMLKQPEFLGFTHWVFNEGLEFEALDKWWERTGVRPTPHEGLDFYCYECRDSC